MSNTKHTPRRRIRITGLEAEAVWGAAGQMENDMEDYYSFMPLPERKKFIAAYKTGMEKLAEIFVRAGLGSKELTKEESDRADAMQENDIDMEVNNR